MIVLTSTSTQSDEREPLFSIDGVEHTIPKEPAANLALQAMDMMRRQGDAVATAWLLETLLGPDSYRALLACDSLTKADMRALSNIVKRKVFGDEEDEPGKG